MPTQHPYTRYANPTIVLGKPPDMRCHTEKAACMRTALFGNDAAGLAVMQCDSIRGKATRILFS